MEAGGWYVSTLRSVWRLAEVVLASPPALSYGLSLKMEAGGWRVLPEYLEVSVKAGRGCMSLPLLLCPLIGLVPLSAHEPELVRYRGHHGPVHGLRIRGHSVLGHYVTERFVHTAWQKCCTIYLFTAGRTVGMFSYVSRKKQYKEGLKL